MSESAPSSSERRVLRNSTRRQTELSLALSFSDSSQSSTPSPAGSQGGKRGRKSRRKLRDLEKVAVPSPTDSQKTPKKTGRKDDDDLNTPSPASSGLEQDLTPSEPLWEWTFEITDSPPSSSSKETPNKTGENNGDDVTTPIPASLGIQQDLTPREPLWKFVDVAESSASGSKKTPRKTERKGGAVWNAAAVAATPSPGRKQALKPRKPLFDWEVDEIIEISPPASKKTPKKTERKRDAVWDDAAVAIATPSPGRKQNLKPREEATREPLWDFLDFEEITASSSSASKKTPKKTGRKVNDATATTPSPRRKKDPKPMEQLSDLEFEEIIASSPSGSKKTRQKRTPKTPGRKGADVLDVATTSSPGRKQGRKSNRQLWEPEGATVSSPSASKKAPKKTEKKDDGARVLVKKQQLETKETSTSESKLREKNVISKSDLKKLFKQVDPTLEPNDDLQELLLQYSDDFMEQVMEGACMIALQRKSTKVETADIKLCLARKFNMILPASENEEGTNNSEQKNSPKGKMAALARQQRLSLIKGEIKKY